MKTKLFLIIILLLSISAMAQNSKAKWTPVEERGQDKVYVDLSGIEKFKGEDIYVWTLTKHSIPVVIESIKDKIYKTNTYYLFNKRLNKYSILYVIYYDKDGNVLGSFDYGRNSNVEIYQYNYPIFDNSIERKVLDKCLAEIKKKNQ